MFYTVTGYVKSRFPEKERSQITVKMGEKCRDAAKQSKKKTQDEASASQEGASLGEEAADYISNGLVDVADNIKINEMLPTIK